MDQLTMVKDKSTRLFNYLKEMTRLRTPTIRNLNTYERVLWFSDIPEEPHCYCQLFNDQKEQKDLWIEIKKPKFPILPNVPREFEDWVLTSELNKTQKDEPELLEKIPLNLNDKLSDEVDYIYLLKNHHHVKKHGEIM